MLDADNIPKVSDFGFSRVVGTEESKGKTQATVGPIRWMAPEQFSKQEYSEKSDVWAYGALIIELLSGQEPFPAMDPIEVAVAVRDGKTNALEHLPADLSPPKWAIKLISQCFTVDDAQRPSFTDVITYLDENMPEGVTKDPNEEVPDVGMDSPRAVKTNKTNKSNKKDPWAAEEVEATPKRITYEDMEKVHEEL